jgi:hypothetical protein
VPDAHTTAVILSKHGCYHHSFELSSSAHSLTAASTDHDSSSSRLGLIKGGSLCWRTACTELYLLGLIRPATPTVAQPWRPPSWSRPGVRPCFCCMPFVCLAVFISCHDIKNNKSYSRNDRTRSGPPSTGPAQAQRAAVAVLQASMKTLNAWNV